jgi:hypothetical protein
MGRRPLGAALGGLNHLLAMLYALVAARSTRRVLWRTQRAIGSITHERVPGVGKAKLKLQLNGWQV